MGDARWSKESEWGEYSQAAEVRVALGMKGNGNVEYPFDEKKKRDKLDEIIPIEWKWMNSKLRSGRVFVSWLEYLDYTLDWHFPRFCLLKLRWLLWYLYSWSGWWPSASTVSHYPTYPRSAQTYPKYLASYCLIMRSLPPFLRLWTLWWVMGEPAI